MTHGSLFSGIGGFDLAAEWAGWDNMFHCEWNEFGQRVLNYYLPKAISYGDITKTDFSLWRGKIDILTGGFPCQDASNAKQHGGGQRGLSGARTGLFWEMVRAVDEIRPNWIVAENVSNILKTNNGRDFRTTLYELGRMGYNAEWRVIRASELGACHHRARLYLVAYSNCIRIPKGEYVLSNVDKEASQVRRRINGTSISVRVSWGVEPGVCRLDDGLPQKLYYESIKAYGNAIVPQVAYQIFKAINQFELK